MLQDIGYLVRKGIGLATITLDINQYEASPKPPNSSTENFTRVDIEQSASGLTSTQENRCLDSVKREHTDWLFGTVWSHSRWVSLDELKDDFLKSGWEMEGEGKNFIMTYAENMAKGWTATQVWGFKKVDGERRYCRNILVEKDDKRVEMRFVYDFLS